MGASTYPVYLKLQGKRCLVVGAGPVGVRKVSGLPPGGPWRLPESFLEI